MTRVDAYTAKRLGESSEQIRGVLAQCVDVRYGSAFDVGSGAGFETFELASRFERVVAIDSRADFIRKGRHIARERGVENITFLAHDALKPLPEHERFDFVYCNNMSHHTASRTALLAQLAESVEPGGWLFVSEEAEGCPAMKIEQALATHDDVMLRDTARQVVNALRRRPGYRVFLQGTLEPLLRAFGFEVMRTEHVLWEQLPHLQRTWAKAVTPKRFETDDPDYLTGQTLDWEITPLVELADAVYDGLSPRPSVLEKVRRKGPRVVRPAQPDWDLAEQLFARFKTKVLADEAVRAAGASSPVPG